MWRWDLTEVGEYCGDSSCSHCIACNLVPKGDKMEAASLETQQLAQNVYTDLFESMFSDKVLEDEIFVKNVDLEEKAVEKGAVVLAGGKKKQVVRTKIEPLFSPTRLYELGGLINSMFNVMRNPYYVKYPPTFNKGLLADLEKISQHWQSYAGLGTKAMLNADLTCSIPPDGLKLIIQAKKKQAALVKQAKKAGKKGTTVLPEEVSYAVIS